MLWSTAELWPCQSRHCRTVLRDSTHHSKCGFCAYSQNPKSSPREAGAKQTRKRKHLTVVLEGIRAHEAWPLSATEMPITTGSPTALPRPCLQRQLLPLGGQSILGCPRQPHDPHAPWSFPYWLLMGQVQVSGLGMVPKPLKLEATFLVWHLPPSGPLRGPKWADYSFIQDWYYLPFTG